jgi:hypothetical protein
MVKILILQVSLQEPKPKALFFWYALITLLSETIERTVSQGPDLDANKRKKRKGSNGLHNNLLVVVLTSYFICNLYFQ